MPATATAKKPEIVQMPPGYCSLVEALEILPVNDSTIERMVRDGRLRSARIARRRRKPQRVYLMEDLARMAREKKARERLEEEKTHRPAVPAVRPAKLDALGALTALLERLLGPQAQLGAPAAIAPASKLWLSLDEAAELSGLARADLERECQRREGKPPEPGQLIVRKSGGWKILRESLEAFKG